MAEVDIERARRCVGANIREHRLRRGWTQGELAERVGVEPLFIRVLEGARRAPSFATLVRLLAALDIEPNQLFEPRELQRNPVGRPPKKPL
ncbi:MAG: helix-turn-helix domain-containing protein [Nannocystales bacterium]